MRYEREREWRASVLRNGAAGRRKERVSCVWWGHIRSITSEGRRENSGQTVPKKIEKESARNKSTSCTLIRLNAILEQDIVVY